MVQIVITKIERNAETGEVRLEWSDGQGMVFPSSQDARDWAGALDDDVEFAKRLEIALWLRRNPSGNNPGLILNKTFTFDLAAANPVTIT